jgi:hypothetical protein
MANAIFFCAIAADAFCVGLLIAQKSIIDGEQSDWPGGKMLNNDASPSIY